MSILTCFFLCGFSSIDVGASSCHTLLHVLWQLSCRWMGTSLSWPWSSCWDIFPWLLGWFWPLRPSWGGTGPWGKMAVGASPALTVGLASPDYTLREFLVQLPHALIMLPVGENTGHHYALPHWTCSGIFSSSASMDPKRVWTEGCSGAITLAACSAWECLWHSFLLMEAALWNMYSSRKKPHSCLWVVLQPWYSHIIIEIVDPCRSDWWLCWNS